MNWNLGYVLFERWNIQNGVEVDVCWWIDGVIDGQDLTLSSLVTVTRPKWNKRRDTRKML